jgi:hypothetical protein
MTAAMYDRLHVVNAATQSVVDIWQKTNGWS